MDEARGKIEEGTGRNIVKKTGGNIWGIAEEKIGKEAGRKYRRVQGGKIREIGGRNTGEEKVKI